MSGEAGNFPEPDPSAERTSSKGINGPALARAWDWQGRQVFMQESRIDRLSHALLTYGSRRAALAALCCAAFGLDVPSVLGRKSAKRQRIHHRKSRRSSRGSSTNKKSSTKKSAFPHDCRHFVIAAGPNRDDKFQHIDDDLRIVLIPKGKKADSKVLLDDHNGSPNGPGGAHLKVAPFSAKVGDRIVITASNKVAGGCELDEIWIHCIEGKGGKVKLTDRITPSQCNGGKVGVFFDRTVRIKNK
jgi:hypothetical protein